MKEFELFCREEYVEWTNVYRKGNSKSYAQAFQTPRIFDPLSSPKIHQSVFQRLEFPAIQNGAVTGQRIMNHNVAPSVGFKNNQ